MDEDSVEVPIVTHLVPAVFKVVSRDWQVYHMLVRLYSETEGVRLDVVRLVV